jgi:hypothetical protein
MVFAAFFIWILPSSWAAKTLAGKVEETMDSGGYTYVMFKQDGKEIWAAAPLCEVKKGETVTIFTGMPMEGFYSPSIKRTFDIIYFTATLKADKQTAGASTLPQGHPPLDRSDPHAGKGLAKGVADASWVRGRVLETMNGGRYTYAQVSTQDGKALWTAGPETRVEKGQWVSFPRGAAMENFESPSLKRTFDEIYFVSGYQVVEGPTVEKPAAAPAPEAVSTPAVAPPEGVVNLKELLGKKKQFSGKNVLVHGRVTKFNANILKTNWIHLSPAAGGDKSLDLTATGKAQVSVGDVVTLKGKVALNKDFGAGYTYDLILEDAVLVK